MQVIFPTVLIATAGRDSHAILAASGLYLFGFTYLYIGIGLLAGLDSTGIGYYSLFVAVMAVGFSYVNFRVLKDPPFGIIWLYWTFLWLPFFFLFGLKVEKLTTYTGWVTAIEGWVTATIPAYLLRSGYWTAPTQAAIALGVFAVVVFGALWLLVGAGHQLARPDRKDAALPGPT